MLYSLPSKMSTEDPDPVGSIINWPPGTGSVIQDYGSVDPDPIENTSGSTTLKISPLASLC